MIRIVLIVILSVFLLIFLNYWYGKKFHPCPECSENVYHLIDIPVPPENYIKQLEDALKTHGSQLNPELNFNNAKGKKLNSVQLEKHCPSIIHWFLTDKITHGASKVLNERVTFADASEKYRIFARIYDDDKDFLNWHYDNNFTDGNRYTLVIPLLVDECNTSEFEYRDRKTSKVHTVRVPLGKGVLYNGSDMYHRITQQTRGCKRMVVIIPLYENYSKSFLGQMREKIRNITYQQLTL